jgi:large subunit ribosomal protein L17
MRHRHDFRKLSRTASHRKALLRNLVTALFLHERIETTVAKAKEARRLAERLITYAKRNNLHSRRLVAAVVFDREVVGKLFDEIAPLYATRPGGYTRILKTRVRLGDAGEMGILELVKTKEQKDAERKRRAEAAAASAAATEKKKGGLFGRRKKEAAPAAEAPEKGANGEGAATDAGGKAEAKPKSEKSERKPRTRGETPRPGRPGLPGRSGPGSSPRKTRGSQRGQ